MTLLLFKKEITKRENSSTSVADRFNKWPFPIPTSGKWGLLGMFYQDHRGRPQRWPMAARRVYICPLSWEHLGVPQVVACFSGNLTNVVLVTVCSCDCVINGRHIVFCHLKLLFSYCLTDVWFSIHMYRNAEAKLFHCILFSDSRVAQGCQVLSVFLPFSLLLNHFDPEGNWNNCC